MGEVSRRSGDAETSDTGIDAGADERERPVTLPRTLDQDAANGSWVDRLTADELGTLDAFDRQLLVDELRWGRERQLRLEHEMMKAGTLTLLAATTSVSAYRKGTADGVSAAAAGCLSEHVRSAISEIKTAANAHAASASRTRPLPEGMSPWVAVNDVMNALGCEKTKANEFLRAAAGRDQATGDLLRVPVDVWETWARENLIDGRRVRRWANEDRTRTRTTSTSAAASGGVGTTTARDGSSGAPRGQRTRKRLGPDSQNGSVRPLIPMLRKTKR